MEMNAEKKRHCETNSDEPDRISNLPESVKEHILSFVDTKAAVRTGILSSSWRALSESLPALDLGRSCFDRSAMNERLPDCDDKDDARKAERESIIRMRTGFYAFLDRALGSHMDIDKLDLYLGDFHLELESRLDGWLAGAVRRNVKELGLEISYLSSPRYSRYGFLESFVLPKLIKKLKLVNCDLSSPCLVDGQLPCLQEIWLEDDYADDVLMATLLSSCPNLEILVLDCCYGFTRLEIVNLPQLEKMVFENYTVHKQVVKIDAPNLCEFRYVSEECNESEIDFGACKNLKVLELEEGQFDGSDLDVILNSHPLLECLVLYNCTNLYHYPILTQYLVNLVFKNCRDLKNVRLDAPNLSFFSYDGEGPMTFVSKGPNHKLKNGCIYLKPDYREEVWSNGLLKLLAKLSWTESLSLCVYHEKDVIIPETMRTKCHSPLYDVKHLMIDLRLSRLKHPVEVIQSLLWLSPCPETISIRSSEFLVFKSLKFTYEKPSGGKKKCSCSKSLPVNCWRHSLVKVCIQNRGGHEDDTELVRFFDNAGIDAEIECLPENRSSDSE